jgi:transcriptional regulator with XRE-family HTH domain
MQAAAAYFQTLREQQGLSRARLALQLDITEMSLYRIEEQGQEPKAELLMKLVRALGANIDHVYNLFADDATPADGRRLALQWLLHEPSEEERRRAALLAVAESLINDPQKLDRLLGYADRLREEGP